MSSESSHPTSDRSRLSEKRRKRISWWFRIALMLPAILVAVALLGALSEKILALKDARLYPPPGELHDVGGFRLHLSCVGEGSPTVILEAGLGRDSLDWSWVQPKLSEITRVCVYDRAGFGWSDPSPRPRNSRNVAVELNQLLSSAGIEGPLVLVGHSAGGSHIELFRHLYPEPVAGMVLIDVAHMAPRPGPPPVMITLARLLRWTGAARWRGFLDGKDLPPEIQAVENALVYRPPFLSTLVAENEAVAESLRQVAAIEATGWLGDLPLIIMTGVGPPEKYKRPTGMTLAQLKEELSARHELQRQMLTFSSNSEQVMARKSGHQIHKDQPELVTEAVGDLALKIRESL